MQEDNIDDASSSVPESRASEYQPWSAEQVLSLREDDWMLLNMLAALLYALIERQAS